MQARFFFPAVFAFVLAPAACGGNPEIVNPPGSTDAGTGGSGGDASNDDVPGGSGGVVLPDGGGTGGGETDADPCATQSCPKDQHCEVRDGAASCVGNDCANLNCSPTEVCVTTDGGAYCDDNTCSTDLECTADHYCNGTVCVADICAAGTERCDGQNLVSCASNGGSETTKYTCASGSPYYQSVCTDQGNGHAACGCQDDWDCPAYTDCDVDSCAGTGVQPSCSLAPEPFQNVLPVNEITWGGTYANPTAVGSPFPSSVQVVMAPIVANLDDDTGDGLIDERDFPEVIFTTFCNHDFTSNGVLRAIHGGGPNKGKDYFASCGTTVWNEGTDPTSVDCPCANADLDSTASLAVGDLDYDGVPEIVAITEGPTAGSSAEVRIYDNKGNIVATSTTFAQGGANPAPTLANIDHAGPVEIVVGRSVFTLTRPVGGNLQFLDRFEGSNTVGTNGQGPVPCVANLVGDSRQEIVAGSTVYALPKPPAGVTRISECSGTETDPEEVAFCHGQLTVVWDGQTVNGTTLIPNNRREGFCAIADVLGTDQAAAPGPTNPLDQVPEVLLISAGYLHVFNGQDGTLRRAIQLDAGGGGGTPNVDDFDGDGFPEVSSAFASAFVVADLQDATSGGACDAWPTIPAQDSVAENAVNPPRTPPATPCSQDADCGDLTKFACNEKLNRCVCLHNGWKRKTEDDSSRVTGSSVFDFNGDGAAEVIYNDECRFRIYDGLNGDVYFREPSESRTRIEYPIVVDVDNDGNAEIVFATTTESGFCSEHLTTQYNAGIEVWGDASDLWVAARRVWNQHAYHVTNVTESASIPVFEPESWKPYNGRIYNTYRSNPRAYGVAPDLTTQAIQMSSPDAVCGQLSNKLDITVQIANVGDLRVGPGVVVSFYGTWGAMSGPLHGPGGVPLTAVLQNSLEPGESILVTVSYDDANDGGVLPDRVRAVIDESDAARECNESNNEIEADVDPGVALPDLRVEVSAELPPACPDPKVPTTVFNDGSAPASNVVVRYYAGDPNAGGKFLQDETIAGPIDAGDSYSFTPALTSFPQGLTVTVWAVVDPDNTIEECNDGNNRDAADDKLYCTGVH